MRPAVCSAVMEFRYRGIGYTIIQATTPDLWRWQVKVGHPSMLRLGEATSELHAEVQVKCIIDRSIDGSVNKS